MKTILSIIMAVGLCATGYSQDTNSTPFRWWESPITSTLSQGTNYIGATYGIYDMKTKEFGGGIGVGYKINDYVVTVVRLDAISDHLFVPSGSIQLQVPMKFLGRIEVTPFTFSGVATSLNGDDNNGEAIGIFGVGGAIKFGNNESAWYVPKGLIGDYEHWTGGGFNDDQVRFGVLFKF